MIGKILGVCLAGLVGLLFLVLGWLLWKKEMISLMHDYHVSKLSPGDRKAFCRLSGIGMIITGASLLVTALLLALTDSAYSFLCFAAGFAVGLGFLIRAGVKYNR